MRGTFQLDVHNLDAGGKTYESAVGASWLRGALEDVSGYQPGESDGVLSVRYSRTGNDVVIRGSITVHLKSTCSRCLGTADCDVESVLSLMLVPATSKKAAFAKGKAGQSNVVSEEYEMQESDAELDTYEGETVVLDSFVREAILLEVPSTPLCGEDCQGIAPPPDPGESFEPSIDPRLAPLLKFKTKGSS